MQDNRTAHGPRRPTAIEARHARSCPANGGGTCSCRPTWRASVYSKRDGKKIRKTFAIQAAAKSWRADSLTGMRNGTMRTPSRLRLDEAALAVIDVMKDGSVRARGGRPFKPSVIRSYE